MIKNIRKFLCLVLCMAILPAMSAAAQGNLYVNESFDEFATNEIPSDLTYSARALYITEYENHNKGLKMYAAANSSKLTFSMPKSESFCLSFDIMVSEKAPSGYVCALNESGAEQRLFTFEQDHTVGAYNGYPVGTVGSKKTVNYIIGYDFKRKSCDIYRDGQRIKKDFRITKQTISNAAEIDFVFSSQTGEDFVIIDNVNINASTEPWNKYPVGKYNGEVLEENTFSFGKNVGNMTLNNSDFETGLTMNINRAGNKVEVVEEEDGNKALMFEKETASDFFAEVNGLVSSSDSIVYEFDLKVLENDSVMVLLQKDTAGKFQALGNLSKGGYWYFPVGKGMSATQGKWNRISVVEDYYNRKIKFYFNKKYIGIKDMDSEFAVNGATAGIFRFHATIYTSFAPTRASDTDPLKYLIDNVRVYEGEELLNELNTVEKSIDLTSKKSVFPSDEPNRKYFENITAIHARSGVILENGTKTMLRNEPYISGGSYMLPVREMLEKFGVSYSEETSGYLKLPTGSAISGETENSEIHNSALYLPIQNMLDFIGRKYQKVNARYNDGLYILDGAKTDLPQDEESIQSINDYAFYCRPDEKNILEDYKKSEVYGQHPRIQATKEDFDRIRSEIKTNRYKQRWANGIISAANLVLAAEPVKYELPDGERLLSICREVLSRMYSLGMAYQITGDKKYSERAYTELETVCKFNDWHPAHHLDPCEMATAVAIGYDWMYDAFTEGQRKVIEQGMYNNAFYDAWLSYQSTSSAMTNSAVATNNHNIVCNGGFLIGALAMMDVYPEVASYVAKNAIRGIDLMMWHFAPVGAWYEGAHYWEYTMQYTAKTISAMESALGTSYGLASCEGMSEAAISELYLESPIGIYNYADSLLARIYTPEMYWLSDRYQNPDATKAVLYFTGGNTTDPEDQALSLLWYDTSIEPDLIKLDKDRFYESLGTMTMRNSWNDSEPTFVGIHAGETNVDHAQLDGGSFIFESQGIRWAKDLGMGNYNSEGYWDNTVNGLRWTHFRSRAESHNTVIINPDSKPDHKVDSFADIKLTASKPKGAIATVDMSELLSENVTGAKRGFFFTDNRTSLVIRDEIKLKKQSDIYWIMITDADAQIDEKGATFTSSERKMRLDFVSNAEAQLSIAKAEPLLTSPKTKPGDEPEETSKRFMIKLSGSGEVNLTVKLSDIDTAVTDVSDYDKSIDLWEVPDGEIPTPPTISEITVDGKNISTNGLKNVDYSYVEGSISKPPITEVNTDLYNVTINNAATLDERTVITLTDKNDLNNKSVYSVYFNKIKKPIDFDGRNSLPVMSFSVSDEPQQQNKAANLFDNDLSTRWSAEGAGNWILLDLGTVRKVDDIAMAFMKSGERVYYFNIAVSEDGVTYEKTFDGQSNATSDYEFYPLGGKNARYIKIECNGNSTAAGENWNSYTELVVTSKK